MGTRDGVHFGGRLASHGQVSLYRERVQRHPSAGDPAPASDTLIAGDVPDLSYLSTAQTPDAALYAISIDDAIAAGKPFVVGFSTPRYCTTGTCGPQVEQLSDLRQRYGERANVIHVEIYKDPHLFEDGERPGKEDVVEAVLEWGLPTEPWTFVVDSEGIIRAKFEAYTPASSIEESLLGGAELSPCPARYAVACWECRYTLQSWEPSAYLAFSASASWPVAMSLV